MNAFANIETANDSAPMIGTACDTPGGGLAYIVAVKPSERATFTLIGGPSPMSRDRFTITIASEAGHVSEISENIAAPMIARARHVAPIGEAEAADLWERAKVKQAESRRKATEEREECDRAAALAKDELQRIAPPWAVAAIVAELHEDASDHYSDYHNHRTLRTVVIGWSKHTRDLFAEMRKAAATFPETADLADAPESAEHREKYSMGAGFYLKRSWRDSSGWCVKKSRLSWLGNSGLEFSDAVRGIGTPIVETAPPIPAGANAAGLFSIERHTHSKKGFAMWICTLAERVEREDFDRFLQAAKALGGWYSRAWAGTPAGFAFKSEAKALEFVGGGDASPPTGEGEGDKLSAPRAPTPRANPADKLRGIADALQPAIDDKFRDRRANTPKQQRQAAEARQDGADMERAQRIARALAFHHDAGTVPACLAGVTTKAALLDLAKEEIDRRNSGYYDAGFPTGKPYPWREADKAERAAAAWALLNPAADTERREAEALQQKIEALKFAKIPGYFPTPADLVARMIREADLLPGSTVLEPSAGSGAIADALREAGHTVECVERHSTLRDILNSKGHRVIASDFLELSPGAYPSRLYDAVIMNPPFENGQDCEHVARAWSFVKPGGALVAIMGAGVTFRGSRPYSTFRAWAEEVGTFDPIPAGTFKESGTGVASVLFHAIKSEG